MYKLNHSWVKLSFIAIVFLFAGQLLSADDTPALTKEQMKQFLLTAKVTAAHSSKKGIADTQRLTLSDGTITHDASFQSIDEHALSKKFSSGRTEMMFVDSYKYNLAAYALAELIGFDDMMPVYVERKYEGKEGSLSWWLSVKMDEADRVQRKVQPPDAEAWNKQMYKVRVFDELVYDTDANLTNVLIGPDWKIWRIDFTRGFRTYRQLKDPGNLVRCERHMWEGLKGLKGDEFTEKTKAYLTKDEIHAVMARRDLIVQFFEKEIAKKGESEVLY